MADTDYVAEVKKYVADPDEAAVAAIVRHLGIALRSRDASLVSCSSKDELARVRESWCKKKLGLTQSDKELDAAIKDVCETMKAEQRKHRVPFYYLLTQKMDKMSALT
jgi:phage host-nuclease inhibitor protein Gam